MDHLDRIKKLQTNLDKNGFAFAFLFYSRDIYYYTGTSQPSCLAVFPDSYFLFVKSGLDFALREVFVDRERVFFERKLSAMSQKIFENREKPVDKSIGVELDILSVNQFRHYEKAFSGFSFADISPIILEQKMVKDPREIEAVRQAGIAVNAGHRAVVEHLKPGMTELELAACIESAQRRAGHEGAFFYRLQDFFMSRGPVASGENLFQFSGVLYSVTGTGQYASLPVGPSNRKIQKGDIVVVDVPVLIKGYHADQTRSYVLGKAGEKKKDLFSRLKEIHDHAIDSLRPGAACSSVYRAAQQKAAQLGVKDVFLSFGKAGKSRMIGHGLGLELSEPPIISDYNHAPVPENGVIALEMHIADGDIGVMKLEDTIWVSEKGNEILTTSPRDLTEIKSYR